MAIKNKNEIMLYGNSGLRKYKIIPIVKEIRKIFNGSASFVFILVYLLAKEYEISSKIEKDNVVATAAPVIEYFGIKSMFKTKFIKAAIINATVTRYWRNARFNAIL